MENRPMDIPKYFTVVMRTAATTGETLYEARHPELPRCMGQGATVAEAEADLREATALMLEYYRDTGLMIPTPAHWTTPNTSRESPIQPAELWAALFPAVAPVP